MFSTDMYKIVKSDGGGVCFDRPILPNAIIFGVVGVLAAFLIFSFISVTFLVLRMSNEISIL